VGRVNLKGWFTTYKNLKSGERAEYHYHRATGMRLNGKPGSPEFIADYAAAEKLIRDRLAGTFNGLVRGYTLSVEFTEKLAASTQAEYKRMLRAAEAEFGNMPLAALDDPRVRKDFLDWREKVARTSGEREADNRLSAISAMLTWAVDRGQTTGNYLRGFRRLYHADRSEIIWLPEHIAAFMEVAPIEMQRALILGLHTGQREGDLLRMPWSAYDGVRISLRQGKARRGGKLGQLIEIPCTSALRRMLDSMDRVSPLILITKTGQSFKRPDGFEPPTPRFVVWTLEPQGTALMCRTIATSRKSSSPGRAMEPAACQGMTLFTVIGRTTSATMPISRGFFAVRLIALALPRACSISPSQI
jgi:hypothetical protein